MAKYEVGPIYVVLKKEAGEEGEGESIGEGEGGRERESKLYPNIDKCPQGEGDKVTPV